MRRFRSPTAAALAAAGAALAATALLGGCTLNGNAPGTTENGITPGPKLPSGYTLPPGAANYQVATPSLSPSP